MSETRPQKPSVKRKCGGGRKTPCVSTNAATAMNHMNYWPFDDYQSLQCFRELVRKLKESSDRGVAFFGAGTSAPAGLPNWIDFHKRYLEHFGAQPAENLTDPAHAMLIDFDYHANREPDKALGFIKNTLAVPISDVPPAVKLARMARLLRYFYTTNLDEVLFKMAAGENVATYPDYMPMDARFVYLHGRASSATSIHDELVLGQTGYERAYGQTDGGIARSKLGLLAYYPVIFIGFSLKDQYVARSLEEITRAARFRPVIPIDVQPEEAISALNWYILLKAPVLTDPGREQEKLLREMSLRNMGVKVIWYQDGSEPDPHRSLLEVLQYIQRESRDLTVSENDPTIVERLIEAEEIASLASPSSSQVGRAKAILEGHPRVAAAFLNRVAGIDWFRNLRDSGSLQPKPSYVAANGERRAPYWQVVGFLESVASVAPKEVKEFLLGLDIDNWFAIRQAFGILEELDDESGEDLGRNFARWAARAMAFDSYSLLDVSRATESLT